MLSFSRNSESSRSSGSPFSSGKLNDPHVSSFDLTASSSSFAESKYFVLALSLSPISALMGLGRRAADSLVCIAVD